MAMGMSYREFWHGDYCQWKYWEEANTLRKKQENEAMWMQGAYIHEAFGVVLSNAFRENGDPIRNYPEEPFRITEMTEEEKEAAAKKQVTEFRNQLMLLKQRFDAKHKRERGE